MITAEEAARLTDKANVKKRIKAERLKKSKYHHKAIHREIRKLAKKGENCINILYTYCDEERFEKAGFSIDTRIDSNFLTIRWPKFWENKRK